MKIIKIEGDTLYIGDDGQNILQFNVSQAELNAQVDDEVEVYGSGSEAIIVKLDSYTESAEPEVTTTTVNWNEPNVPYPEQAGNGALLAAFILNLLTTIGVGWFIIPLAWMIPLTVMSYKAYKGTRPNTTALGVVTLIFVNVIAGILQLVSPRVD